LFTKQSPLNRRIKFAARRGGAPIQFFQNWENDAIFCNPIQWIAKNGIVFAYGFAYGFVPISVAVNCNISGYGNIATIL
jgi:hypothetical protein